MSVDLETRMEVDPWSWSYYNAIKLSSGPFTLEGHCYLVEFMQDGSRIKVVMKATQGGFTAAAILISTHGLRYGIYNQGVLYLFPSWQDVTRFSQSRFTPLIDQNPSTIGRYVGVNNVEVKKIGQGTLYLLGASLTQKIGGIAKESGALRSNPVDMFVVDEEDLMDPSVVMKARGRMAHCKGGGSEIHLSNPTIPDYAIHNHFLKSDQRYWVRKCKCGRETTAVKDYQRCVHIRKDGTGYIGCYHCGRELPNDEGFYVADYPDNDIAGWHWSQFESAFIDPAQIIRDLEDPPQGNMADVYRLRLGLPYIEAENRLTPQDIYGCCGNEGMAMRDEGPCAMGVDIGGGNRGSRHHVVIGQKLGEDTFKILWFGVVTHFNDFYDLAKRFGVKSAIFDLRPEQEKVRDFQKGVSFIVYGCQYMDKTKQNVKIDDQAGVITFDRTSAFDYSHKIVTERRIQLPRRSESLDEYTRQMCNCARVLEENEETGDKIYRYRKLGDDHYRSATNYFLYACQNVGIATEYRPRYGRKKNEYTHEVAFA